MAAQPSPRVEIYEHDFDVSTELRALRTLASGQPDTRVGAVASFVGTVRDLNQGDAVQMLTLEHYPGMTEKSIEDILDQAAARWPLFGLKVIHRVGPLQPSDQIVFVGVTSAHREAALAACAFVMDYLKTLAPFWKKEALPGQTSRWVDARETDQQAADRWKS
ncbi:MAG: hypothetical protein RL483_316 [Pseudomonadota bacterium]|jgi:molybdopterin synthase catalytic subunit